MAAGHTRVLDLSPGRAARGRDLPGATERGEVLTARLTAAWQSRDPAAVAGLYVASAELERFTFPAARFVGRDEIADAAGEVMAAVPDLVVAAWCLPHRGGIDVTLEWVLAGTHDGSLPWMPARPGHVEVRGASVCRLGGASIVRERAYWSAPKVPACGACYPMSRAREIW